MTNKMRKTIAVKDELYQKIRDVARERGVSQCQIVEEAMLGSGKEDNPVSNCLRGLVDGYFKMPEVDRRKFDAAVDEIKIDPGMKDGYLKRL